MEEKRIEDENRNRVRRLSFALFIKNVAVYVAAKERVRLNRASDAELRLPPLGAFSHREGEGNVNRRARNAIRATTSPLAVRQYAN